MTDSPVAKAEELLEQIKASRTLKDRAAYAILHEDQASECIEDLIAYLRGFELGSAAEQKRLLELVTLLLKAIAPLFAHPYTPHGRPSHYHEWLSGTAPRLRRAYEQATEYLKG